MLRSIGSLTALALLMVGCGGGGTSSPPPPPPPANYTVGGTVTGLTGSGLVLMFSDSALSGPHSVSLAVSTAGGFTFSPAVPGGSSYTVYVGAQPESPLQDCTVTNGTGTIGVANITSVSVACSNAASYTVGGTVTGLTGSGLVLELNDSAFSGPHPVALAVSTSGGFTFSPAVRQGTFYRVYVGTEPGSPTQNCVVTNGTGVVGTVNIDISIACAGVGRFAYAANAGDNTISVYSIDAISGALSPVGTPVPTGTSPNAIVGSPDRQHVYVVNESTNNISAYAVNATSGALTEIAGSPYAAGTDPQALAFDRTGSYLYVANNGDNNLSAYAVDASTGALTPLPAPTYATGTGPTAVSVDGAGKFAFVANHGGSNNISVFAINAATGELTPVAGSPFAASDNPASNPRSLVFVDSPGLYSLYVTTVDPADGPGVAEFTVDQVTGALTFVTTWIVSVDNYLATDRNGRVLYGATAGAVDGYQILSGGDLLTLTAFPYATGTNAYSVTVDPSNQFLYVANEGAGNISGFKLNHGGLIPITGSPFPAGHHPKFIATL